MLNSLDTLVTRNMFLFTTTGSFCQTFKSIFRARGLRPAFQAAVVRDSVQRTTQQPCSAAVASLRPPFGRSEVGKPKAGSELPLARCSDHLTSTRQMRDERERAASIARVGKAPKRKISLIPRERDPPAPTRPLGVRTRTCSSATYITGCSGRTGTERQHTPRREFGGSATGCRAYVSGQRQ
jgi:hypothetical protein